MNKSVFALCAVLVAALVLPGRAHAQVSAWELNLHGGALIYDIGFGDEEEELGDDDTDTDFILGARLVRNTSSGFAIGGNFDWVLADQINLPEGAGDDDLDINLYFYSIEVDYVFPTGSRVQPFVGLGFGFLTTDVTDLPTEFGDETQTDPLIPIAVGLKIVDDPEYPRWGFRADVRDNAVIRDIVVDFETGEEDSEWEDNFEISAGFSFFFGGPRYTEPEPEPIGDADGDGVLDDRDRCPNTPMGTQVDSTGCPIPVDSDGDGVMDDRDQCPNTPAGTEVDSTGCPIPEPPAACVDGRDWYRSDAQISVEGAGWVKFGSSRTLTMDELTRIGEYDGVPVYVRTGASRPYTEVFLPLCAPANTYQTYRPAEAIRGTTG